MPKQVEINDQLPSLKMRLEQITAQTSPSIYKVPRHLLDVNNKAFEPEIVSIGPWYRGKPKLKNMEELKLRYVQSLVKRKPDVPLEHYISAVEGMSQRARECYSEPPMKIDDFIDMLVLDGCFIIELIQSPQLYDSNFPDRSGYRILQRDLILMENQIPFFVLCKLFDLVQGPNQHHLLMEHVLRFCVDVFPGNILYRATTMRSSEEVQHILDLIHFNWCPYDHQPIVVEDNCFPITSPHVIPSASELKDANVMFCDKEYGSAADPFMLRQSKCTTLFDVEFKDKGKLLMPSLVIDDGTESLLRNLIAYEQLFPMHKPASVADYATLLDCLISKPKDVRILCSRKIIVNMLGSNKAVKDFVNRLTETVVVDQKNFKYSDVFRRINLHHQKRWNRALAVFHRDYFSSAWAYIAFMGALLLLLLTVAQTVFTALQVYKPAGHSNH